METELTLLSASLKASTQGDQGAPPAWPRARCPMQTCPRLLRMALALVLTLPLPAASTLQFAAVTATVAENAGVAPLTVQRSGAPETEVSLDYASTNLTATPRFTPLATNLPGQSGTTTYTDTNAAAAPRLLYRVGVR